MTRKLSDIFKKTDPAEEKQAPVKTPIDDKKEEEKHKSKTKNFAESKNNHAKTALRSGAHTIFCKKPEYFKAVFHIIAPKTKNF